MDTALKKVRHLVSQNKRRFIAEGWDLDLSYITDRIIAMGFPAVGFEKYYRNPRKEVVRFLNTKYAGRFKVFNVCAETSYQYDPAVFDHQVCSMPFWDHNPAPLFLVAAFCLEAEAWLCEHPDNIIVIHCKAGRGRTGFITACLLIHLDLEVRADEAVDFFSQARTVDGSAVHQPSQRRYTRYWELLHRAGRITHVNEVIRQHHAGRGQQRRKGLVAGSLPLPTLNTSLDPPPPPPSSLLSTSMNVSRCLPFPGPHALHLGALLMTGTNAKGPKRLFVVISMNGIDLVQRWVCWTAVGLFVLRCGFDIQGDVSVRMYVRKGRKKDQEDEESDDDESDAAEWAPEQPEGTGLRQHSDKSMKLVLRFWFNTFFVVPPVLTATKQDLDVQCKQPIGSGMFLQHSELRLWLGAPIRRLCPFDLIQTELVATTPDMSPGSLSFDKTMATSPWPSSFPNSISEGISEDPFSAMLARNSDTSHGPAPSHSLLQPDVLDFMSRGVTYSDPSDDDDPFAGFLRTVDHPVSLEQGAKGVHNFALLTTNDNQGIVHPSKDSAASGLAVLQEDRILALKADADTASFDPLLTPVHARNRPKGFDGDDSGTTDSEHDGASEVQDPHLNSGRSGVGSGQAVPESKQISLTPPTARHSRSKSAGLVLKKSPRAYSPQANTDIPKTSPSSARSLSRFSDWTKRFTTPPRRGRVTPLSPEQGYKPTLSPPRSDSEKDDDVSQSQSDILPPEIFLPHAAGHQPLPSMSDALNNKVDVFFQPQKPAWAPPVEANPHSRSQSRSSPHRSKRKGKHSKQAKHGSRNHNKGGSRSRSSSKSKSRSRSKNGSKSRSSARSPQSQGRARRGTRGEQWTEPTRVQADQNEGNGGQPSAGRSGADTSGSAAGNSNSPGIREPNVGDDDKPLGAIRRTTDLVRDISPLVRGSSRNYRVSPGDAGTPTSQGHPSAEKSPNKGAHKKKRLRIISRHGTGGKGQLRSHTSRTKVSPLAVRSSSPSRGKRRERWKKDLDDLPKAIPSQLASSMSSKRVHPGILPSDAPSPPRRSLCLSSPSSRTSRTSSWPLSPTVAPVLPSPSKPHPTHRPHPLLKVSNAHPPSEHLPRRSFSTSGSVHTPINPSPPSSTPSGRRRSRESRRDYSRESRESRTSRESKQSRRDCQHSRDRTRAIQASWSGSRDEATPKSSSVRFGLDSAGRASSLPRHPRAPSSERGPEIPSAHVVVVVAPVARRGRLRASSAPDLSDPLQIETDRSNSIIEGRSSSNSSRSRSSSRSSASNHGYQREGDVSRSTFDNKRSANVSLTANKLRFPSGVNRAPSPLVCSHNHSDAVARPLSRHDQSGLPPEVPVAKKEPHFPPSAMDRSLKSWESNPSVPLVSRAREDFAKCVRRYRQGLASEAEVRALQQIRQQQERMANHELEANRTLRGRLACIKYVRVSSDIEKIGGDGRAYQEYMVEVSCCKPKTAPKPCRPWTVTCTSTDLHRLADKLHSHPLSLWLRFPADKLQDLDRQIHSLTTLSSSLGATRNLFTCSPSLQAEHRRLTPGGTSKESPGFHSPNSYHTHTSSTQTASSDNRSERSNRHQNQPKSKKQPTSPPSLAIQLNGITSSPASDREAHSHSSTNSESGTSDERRRRQGTRHLRTSASTNVRKQGDEGEGSVGRLKRSESARRFGKSGHHACSISRDLDSDTTSRRGKDVLDFHLCKRAVVAEWLNTLLALRVLEVHKFLKPR